MIDLDYNNESNDYILDMFYGIEDEEFYIGIKYKDGSVSKYPFTIHNYNAIIARLERQYKELIDAYPSHKLKELMVELINVFLDVVFLIFINNLFYSEDKFMKYWLLMISSLTCLLTTGKRVSKVTSLSLKEAKLCIVIEKYLKNKENFLIELAHSDFTYGLNIANINGNTKEMPYNEEIKGQMKLLKYIAERENSRDDLNG